MKNKLFLSSHVEVKDSPIEGRGVFCTSPFKKGDLIEEAHLILLKNNKWEDCDAALKLYALPWVELREDWKEFCDKHDGILSQHATRPVVVLGFGMIYNHADENNVDYFIDKHRFICSYKANRDIEAQSELTIDYGADYFELSKIKKR